MINGRNYIGGDWQRAQGGSFQSTDPFDNSPQWEGRHSDSTDVSSAVDAARGAFESWSARPLAERQDLLVAYSKRLEENKAELAELISREVGKPLWESVGEVGAMIGKIAVSIKAMADRCRETSLTVGDAQSVTRFKPHGVVAVFGPFNFPGHLPNGHIVPALLAGNTVVYKPSEMAPAVGQRMVDLLVDSGIPTGVINLVQGGRETGVALSSHEGLDGLYFTGSSNVGSALHRQFGGQPEKVLALEMGGNNPLIVHDMDDLAAAVYWTIQSSFITAGQRCVCARRLIVTESETNDQFVDQLMAAIPHVQHGHYRDTPEPFLGPVISSQAADRVLNDQSRLLNAGAKGLVPSERSDRSAALLSPGLIDVTGVDGLDDEEIFGPLLQLRRVPDLDAAIDEANNTQYGLAAGIFCRSPEDHEQYFRRSRAGIVNWNKPTTGASSAAPFGGIGRSGNHNPSAYFAADYCSYPVASMESTRLSLPEKQSPGIAIAPR